MIPEGRGVFPRLTVRENLRMASYSGIDTAAIEHRGVRALPPSGRAMRSGRRHPVRRRAADAGTGPRARHRPGGARPRRALDGSRAAGRRRALRAGREASRTRACRSWWSSSSPGPSSASPTSRRSCCTAGSPQSVPLPKSKPSCRPPTSEQPNDTAGCAGHRVARLAARRQVHQRASPRSTCLHPRRRPRRGCCGEASGWSPSA